MTRSNTTSEDLGLRWEEGKVDREQEHFLLFHSDLGDQAVAWVGPRQPVGLRVQFLDDIPSGARRDLRDELWSWCTAQPEDPWFEKDLWHHLAEYALGENVVPETVRWELVPRRAGRSAQRSFVQDVTALCVTWLERAGAKAAKNEKTLPGERVARSAFICDYVALFALGGGEPRQVLGRLTRFVHLQTGEDPTVRLEVRLVGDGCADLPLRLRHLDDFNFAHAWACTPYDGITVRKVGRDEQSEGSPRMWKRGEVRTLLQHVDDALSSEVPFGDFVAEAEGPLLRVRFYGDEG